MKSYLPPNELTIGRSYVDPAATLPDAVAIAAAISIDGENVDLAWKMKSADLVARIILQLSIEARAVWPDDPRFR
jgi:hypothetical protein